MTPQVLAIIQTQFEGELRARAIGAYSLILAVGVAAGQVLGGLLVKADVAGLGWRSIFLINVPIGAVVAFVALRRLPEQHGRSPEAVDPIGALGVACALALVLGPLTVGRTDGWPTWTWISMGASLPVALVTLAWERALARRGRAPVLDLALLRRPSFLVGLAAGGAFMFAFASLMFTLTLLLQGGLGLDAFQAGLVFSPMGVFFGVAALYGPGLVRRHGLRLVVLGSLLIAVGLGLLVLFLADAGTDVGVVRIMLALSIAGLGNGLVLPSLIGAALVTVQPHSAGVASGIFVTAQQFAGSAGVAATGAVFFAALDGRDYATAMEWAGGLCLLMTLVVMALVGAIARAAPDATRATRAATARAEARPGGPPRARAQAAAAPRQP
jgi:MFS family permease